MYIGEVTYSLSLTLTYEEIEKGSTNEKKIKNMILPLVVSSVDIIVKIVLRDYMIGSYKTEQSKRQ